jgi:(p)ppGpp synthase/HD superfamily hydrolase
MDTDNMTTGYRIAHELARKFHGSQKYGEGSPTTEEPYIKHLERVADRAWDFGDIEIYAIVGLLHDILEDTECKPEDILAAGFNVVVVEAVQAITHNKGESYDDYIHRVKLDGVARMVKIADLLDNIEHCLFYGNDKYRHLLPKYIKALDFLSQGL